MKHQRRSFDIFNLSFLDIISCGFGAVVLLVLISRTTEAPVIEVENEATSMLSSVLDAEAQIQSLENKLVAQEKTNAQAIKKLGLLKNQASRQSTASNNTDLQNVELQNQLDGLALAQSSLDRLKQATTNTRKPSSKRDIEVGGIPVDSDYVVFIVDTSGSMQSIWPQVTSALENVINIHPKVRGFQIMNDNGQLLMSAYSKRWIPDTPSRRRSVIKLFSNWNSASNSSPVEGLEVALKRYANPNIKVSIYIFGDEYSGSSYGSVIRSLQKLNKNRVNGSFLARVHGIGFMSVYSTGRFGILMREVARLNGGTFIALPNKKIKRSKLEFGPIPVD